MHACMHMFTEVCLTMRALSGARCTDARPYTLQIKICTRTTNARERLHCWTHIRYDCWLDANVKDMGNDQMQLLQTWLMVGCKCNIHGSWLDETVTDMHADSMQLIKKWLLVRYNCKIHAWWSGAIVPTSPLVGYEHRDITAGLRQV